MMASRSEIALRAKQDATEARLSGLALPSGGAWAQAARQDALARLRAAGLPGRRDEYWKYTDPTPLVTSGSAPAAIFGYQEETRVFSGIDRLRIVFVDGVFDPAASDPLAMAGVEIEWLADAAARDIHWAKDIYGRLEAAGQVPVARTLATLNTAFAETGLVIRVTGKAPRPVSLIYQRRGEATDVVLHHVIRVEQGASLTLLENGSPGARSSVVTEVDVADGGAFHHLRTQGRDHERLSNTHVFARLGAESVLKSFTLTSNGRLTRNEFVVDLAGRGGVVHLAGAAVGDGGSFHQDDTVFITHSADRCESRQVFKKVLRRGAVGVFQGKILVRQAAQQTDGYQISQALLLDDDAQFLAKPELEIYADDVKCSHGSTSGAIDEDMLFYLRARGVPRDDAQRLLVLAFLAEALNEIEDEALAEDLRARLFGWLERHRGE
jgi:Fe-S cluster assembly protein SufD